MKRYTSPRELRVRRRATKILKILKKLFPKPKIALRHRSNWELLVAVILSAQCTDKKVNEVTGKLFKKYRKLDDYVHAKRKEFERDIKSTGFYRNKTKNILLAAKVIKYRFDGKIPKTMDEMLVIPGVARKTANIVLGDAHGIVEGIAVDTHVIRLSKKLGLTDYNDPKKIERDLMEIFPKKEWRLLSHRLIKYGRKYCPAKSHQHAKCPLP